jgi:chemotaxis protein methyltransferase CheR
LEQANLQPTLGASLFAELARFIGELAGINLSPGKRSMLESRLQRRLRALDLTSFDDYVGILAAPETRGGELPHLIDAVTTNQTAFFREPAQFEYLAREGLARLAGNRGRQMRPLRAWSAASSTGEEPYTLAMVLEAYAGAHFPAGYEIVASDISRRVLEHGRRGIYTDVDLQAVPPEMRRFFMRARDRRLGLVRVTRELRAKVRFLELNLMASSYALDEGLDIVFCRNVLIYFAPEIQGAVLGRICRHLRPGRTSVPRPCRPGRQFRAPAAVDPRPHLRAHLRVLEPPDAQDPRPHRRRLGQHPPGHDRDRQRRSRARGDRRRLRPLLRRAEDP